MLGSNRKPRSQHERYRCNSKRRFGPRTDRRNPSPKLLTNNDVKRGPNERIVGDIDYWVENIKRPKAEEQLE